MAARAQRWCRTWLAAGAGWAVALGLIPPAAAQVNGSEVPTGPPTTPYQIRLGPRKAQASPTHTHDGQTGGGAIDVQQPLPHVLLITMRGAAVAGTDCKQGAAASITFELDQEFTVTATRPGLRPPRLGIAARVVGTLDTSDQGKGCGCSWARWIGSRPRRVRGRNRSCSWRSGARFSRFRTWLTRARLTCPSRASSAELGTAPERSSPSRRIARAISRATRGTRPGSRGGRAGTGPSRSSLREPR